MVKNLYAVHVGLSGPDGGPKKTEVKLRSKGWIAYSIRDSRNNKKIRLLIGAFGIKKEAQGLTNKLQKQGFTTHVVLR